MDRTVPYVHNLRPRGKGQKLAGRVSGGGYRCADSERLTTGEDVPQGLIHGKTACEKASRVGVVSQMFTMKFQFDWQFQPLPVAEASFCDVEILW